jgi:hypothetical protein
MNTSSKIALFALLFVIASSSHAARSPRLTLEVEGVPEISGAVLDRDSQTLWTIPDSGNGNFLGRTDLHTDETETIEIDGTENEDWEAIVQEPSGDLWILDVGDNDHERESVQFYRVGQNLKLKQELEIELPEAMDIEAAAFVSNAVGAKIFLFEKTDDKPRVLSVTLPSRRAKSAKAQNVGKLPKVGKISDASLSTSGKLYLLTGERVLRCENCLGEGTPSIRTVRKLDREKPESLVALDDRKFLVGEEDGYFSTED